MIEYAQQYSIHKSAAKFQVDRKRVREWISKKDEISGTKPKRCRLDGGGRKIQNKDLEEELLSLDIWKKITNVTSVTKTTDGKGKIPSWWI